MTKLKNELLLIKQKSAQDLSSEIECGLVCATFFILFANASFHENSTCTTIELDQIGKLLEPRVKHSECLEIINYTSLNYALLKLLEDIVIPLSHFVSKAFEQKSYHLEESLRISPVTLEQTNDGYYCGGGFHSILFSDFLKMIIENGFKRPDGGIVKEIYRIGNPKTNNFIKYCTNQNINLLQKEIQQNTINVQTICALRNDILTVQYRRVDALHFAIKFLKFQVRYGLGNNDTVSTTDFQSQINTLLQRLTDQNDDFTPIHVQSFVFFDPYVTEDEVM